MQHSRFFAAGLEVGGLNSLRFFGMFTCARSATLSAELHLKYDINMCPKCKFCSQSNPGDNDECFGWAN